MHAVDHKTQEARDVRCKMMMMIDYHHLACIADMVAAVLESYSPIGLTRARNISLDFIYQQMLVGLQGSWENGVKKVMC